MTDDAVSVEPRHLARGADAHAAGRWRSPGIVFAVLLSAVLVLIRLAVPRDPEAGGRWLSDDGKRSAVLLALNLLPFAGSRSCGSSASSAIASATREDRPFATVFLGSGLLFIAMLFATGAIAGGLVLAAEEGAPSPSGVRRRIVFTPFTVYAMRMAAVFTISSTTIAMRPSAWRSRRLTFSGLATGVVLLFSAGAGDVGPASIFLAWVFVLSVPHPRGVVPRSARHRVVGSVDLIDLSSSFDRVASATRFDPPRTSVGRSAPTRSGHGPARTIHA